MKIFLATAVLQSIQITVFVSLYSFISCKIIYSQISKLLAPVIASIPFNPLKLALTGKLVEPRVDRVLFVTHGGFPRTRIFDLSFMRSFDEKRKKSELMIVTLSSCMVSLQ